MMDPAEPRHSFVPACKPPFGVLRPGRERKALLYANPGVCFAISATRLISNVLVVKALRTACIAMRICASTLAPIGSGFTICNTLTIVASVFSASFANTSKAAF